MLQVLFVLSRIVLHDIYMIMRMIQLSGEADNAGCKGSTLIQ